MTDYLCYVCGDYLDKTRALLISPCEVSPTDAAEELTRYLLCNNCFEDSVLDLNHRKLLNEVNRKLAIAEKGIYE